MTSTDERTFLTRIEEREAEKRQIAEDIKDIYSEAKDAGLDVPLLRLKVRLRKLDVDKRAKLEEALQGLADLPLGKAAIEREARA